MVEQRPFKPLVRGSSPRGPTCKQIGKITECLKLFLILSLNLSSRLYLLWDTLGLY
jgi:hypothetical protein